MLQPGQVSEGPFLNDPQTVDVPHRTAETKGELWAEMSCKHHSAVNSHTRARRSRVSPPACEALSVVTGCVIPRNAKHAANGVTCRCRRCGPHSHLSQAVERQEGVPLDLRDAVALGDLAVAQTHGSRLTHGE